jgi:hypothetical protein
MRGLASSRGKAPSLVAIAQWLGARQMPRDVGLQSCLLRVSLGGCGRSLADPGAEVSAGPASPQVLQADVSSYQRYPTLFFVYTSLNLPSSSPCPRIMGQRAPANSQDLIVNVTGHKLPCHLLDVCIVSTAFSRVSRATNPSPCDSWVTSKNPLPNDRTGVPRLPNPVIPSNPVSSSSLGHVILVVVLCCVLTVVPQIHVLNIAGAILP